MRSRTRSRKSPGAGRGRESAAGSLGRGAQLVEVLPEDEYRELHLPDAINIPLKELDARHADRLDPARPVIVYCWDALCDMSPRAATRLAQLGFEVYDYALSKVDWMAHGLPVEGTGAARPTVLVGLQNDRFLDLVPEAALRISAADCTPLARRVVAERLSALRTGAVRV